MGNGTSRKLDTTVENKQGRSPPILEANSCGWTCVDRGEGGGPVRGYSHHPHHHYQHFDHAEFDSEVSQNRVSKRSNCFSLKKTGGLLKQVDISRILYALFNYHSDAFFKSTVCRGTCKCDVCNLRKPGIGCQETCFWAFKNIVMTGIDSSISAVNVCARVAKGFELFSV